VLRAKFAIGKQSGCDDRAQMRSPDKIRALRQLMPQQASWVSQDVRPDRSFNGGAPVGRDARELTAAARTRAYTSATPPNWIKERVGRFDVIGNFQLFHPGTNW